MKLSLNWLKDFVDINVKPESLSERLTLSGTAVDGFEPSEDQYQNVVVAEIKKVMPHPKADRLQIALVYDGREERKIVCGAKNIAKGQKVPLALPKAILPDGIEIKETVIRGVKSQGMLCSPKELGLGDNHTGIFILSPGLNPGSAFADHFEKGDVVFDLDLTPNRSDCFSVLGIAREVAALFQKNLHNPYDIDKKLSIKRAVEKSKEIVLEITDKYICPKFCAVIIKGVKMQESPEWLKQRLQSSGVRPINNIVDITNYIMIETGQPLHAFDLQKLKGPNRKVIIGVRRARKNETIVTLDGKKRQLDEHMVVVTGGKAPVSIAGVMGGADTEVTDQSVDIVLEGALWNSELIRYTYRRLGLRTESAVRFEKGIDWNMRERSVVRAAYLMEELSGGKIISSLVVSEDKEPDPVVFWVSLKYINKLLGMKFQMKEIKKMLSSIFIEVSEKDTELFQVTVPSWRHDLKIPADIAEEVGRLYNYNKIAPVPIHAPVVPPKENKIYLFKSRIKELLQAVGYHEVFTYSFYGEKHAHYFHEANHMEVENPVNEDQQFLRRSLIPLLLEKASMNLRFFSDVNMYEIGVVFKDFDDNSPLPKEETFCTGVISHKGKSAYDIYKEVKGDLEVVHKELGINNIVFEKQENYIDVLVDEEWLGNIFVLNEERKKEYKFRQEVIVFNFDLAALFAARVEEKKFTHIPQYPEIVHDLSLLVPADIKYINLKSCILRYADIIENVDCIDEYITENNERSLTVRVIYRSSDRTLKSEEIENIEDNLMSDLHEKFNIKQRS